MTLELGLEHPRMWGKANVLLIAIATVLIPLLIDGFFRKGLYAVSPAAYWVFDISKFVLLPLAAAVVIARRDGIRPRDYGMRGVAEHDSWPYFLGLVFFLAVILDITYYAVLHLAWAIVSSFSAAEPEQLFYASITPQGILRMPVALYMAATAAFVEEIFCRGLPYLYLKRRYPDSFPRQGYIWGTAVVFSLLH